MQQFHPWQTTCVLPPGNGKVDHAFPLSGAGQRESADRQEKVRPTGYALHGVAELLGFIVGLSLLGIALILGSRGITVSFSALLHWLLAAPIGVGIIAEILLQVSCLMAIRKGFEYDQDAHASSWIEGGKRVRYKWQPSDTFDHAARAVVISLNVAHGCGCVIRRNAMIPPILKASPAFQPVWQAC